MSVRFDESLETRNGSNRVTYQRSARPSRAWTRAARERFALFSDRSFGINAKRLSDDRVEYHIHDWGRKTGASARSRGEAGQRVAKLHP